MSSISQKITTFLAAVAVLGVFAFVAWQQFELPRETEPAVFVPADVSPAGDESVAGYISSVGERYQFAYLIVADAREVVTVDTPSADTLAADVADYVVRVSNSPTINEAFVSRDRAESLETVSGEDFTIFANNQSDPATVYQLLDEVSMVASELGTTIDAPALADRSDEVVVVGAMPNNSYTGEAAAAHPPLRAVQGFMIAELYAVADPSNAEQYRQEARDFAERGILYGQYGVSGVDAAADVVRQYLAIVSAEQPDILTNLTI